MKKTLELSVRRWWLNLRVTRMGTLVSKGPQCKLLRPRWWHRDGAGQGRAGQPQSSQTEWKPMGVWPSPGTTRRFHPASCTQLEPPGSLCWVYTITHMHTHTVPWCPSAPPAGIEEGTHACTRTNTQSTYSIITTLYLQTEISCYHSFLSPFSFTVSIVQYYFHIYFYYEWVSCTFCQGQSYQSWVKTS